MTSEGFCFRWTQISSTVLAKPDTQLKLAFWSQKMLTKMLTKYHAG